MDYHRAKAALPLARAQFQPMRAKLVLDELDAPESKSFSVDNRELKVPRSSLTVYRRAKADIPLASAQIEPMRGHYMESTHKHRSIFTRLHLVRLLMHL